MRERFRKICQRRLGLDKNNHVLLALSGGVDSMVLLSLLMGLEESDRPHLTLAHVHHHLREESDAELDFVEDVAQTYGLELMTDHWLDRPERGVELAARQFRYDFFARVMKDLGADVLMTGHHQSDQAETIMMRMVRGGAWQRLKGIFWKQAFAGGQLMRPLLAFTKKEIYAYSQEENIKYVEDQTNFEQIYTRNRYRNQILPLIKKENPNFESQCQNLAEELQDVDQVLFDYLDGILANITKEKGKILDRQLFLQNSEALQRLLLKQWLKKQLQDQVIEISPGQFRKIAIWIREGRPNSSWPLSLPIVLFRSYDSIYIGEERQEEQEQDSEPIQLGLNAWTDLNNEESIGFFESDKKDILETKTKHTDTYIYIDADDLQLPLQATHRQAGDRMSLKGQASYSKKVKDIFIDLKVPLKERDQAWLIKDNEGQILWLVNYKESSRSKDYNSSKKQCLLIYQNRYR